MVRHRNGKLLPTQNGGTADNSKLAQSSNNGFVTPTDMPLPRHKRRPRRARADRGLPPDEELSRLAEEYLTRQRKHWPELVKAGLLPEPTPAVVRQMVDDFKVRHRTGEVEITAVAPYAKAVPKLAGDYNRYSCDNSNPTSILDQMVKALEKARQEDRFVVWSYLFCDYSVTGLDPSRQGYSSYKKVLADEQHQIETTYIDDFSRASRDEIEWWKLAALSKKYRKRMIGASDGFDLSNPNSDVLITVFGLVSRLFIKSLREKVRRGMKGAARRGTSLGKQSLGFTRRVHRDEHGQVVYRPDGRPRHEPCIDPLTKDYRALLYELYVDKKWSAYKISRHFNKLKVDDWNGWTESTIKKLLGSPTAIGIFIWNKTHQEYDLEEEKWIKVRNPRSEWEVHYDPDLAIVSLDHWRAARKRLAASRRASRLTGRKPTRNQVSATTLFSGTLYCEHCQREHHGDGELKLIRSCGKYKQMGCLNGVQGTHGCPLSTSKSVKIIEDCLLAFLRDPLITEQRIRGELARSNAYLEREAAKPRVNTTPLHNKARKLEAAIRKLVMRVEKEPSDELCAGYDKRIKELQREVNGLRVQIQEAESQNRRRDLKSLDLNRAMTYLADLRGLLSEEIPMAAEAIRTLTGPILIRQEPIPGRKTGARWIATFSPDLLRILRQLSKDNKYPESIVLANVEPTKARNVKVPIEKVPKYEQLAPEFKRLRDGGASNATIAAAHGMAKQQAAEILHFADTGERPKWKAGKRTGTGARPVLYLKISKEVAQLRDKKKMSFPRIAAKLKVAESTVRRAYDHHHRDKVREAAERGETPSRGPYSHLGEAVFKKIRKLLRAGRKPMDIASSAGCSVNTVRRVRKQMQEAADGDRAA